jgi:hypothetical protein
MSLKQSSKASQGSKWGSSNKKALKLTDKLTGLPKYFTMHHERDLPFLDPKNSESALIRKKIIPRDVDDDCQTDDEESSNKKRKLRFEVEKAIAMFMQDKLDGTIEVSIKNFDLNKRFSRVPFG